MTCTESKKYLDAYLDGELETGLMLEVEGHLDGCETCSSMYSLKERMKSEIAALGEGVRAPDSLRMRIEALPSRRSRGWLIALGAGIPAAAAAALLIVFTVGGAAGSDQPISSLVDEVVERHARELPMEVGGPDPAQAATWFRGKVDFPVSAPRLGLKNASFKGARLSNVEARQAAHMVYSVDGHRVTMMIFPSERLKVRGGDVVNVNGRDVVLGRRNGYNVAVMFDGDMAYALSSDLPSKRLVSMFSDLSI